MCGIFGIVSRHGILPEDNELLRRLADSLVHRGPDGEGFHREPHVALGMRRLAIIDLEGGWQPLFNENEEIALVGNGEIYNFIELRKELESRGHRFRTGSDCETIIHLYEELGPDCVHRLRGMFAFALWDRRRQTLLVARDRIGEKPLYLAQPSPGRLVFASEMGALVASGAVPFELDDAAVKLYYHYGLVPEPLAMVKGVRKLPAGHLLLIKVDPVAGSFNIDERRYWNMEDAPPIEADPVRTVRDVLDEVGELIIRSDVPVGVALSGGIDSSAIASLAARKYAKGQIQAFTIGYPGRPVQDERSMAKELTDHLGIPLHTMELSVEEVVRSYPEVCFRRDDPIADIAGPSYLAVMRLARSKGVPVMLMGQGGDELFWGYPWVARCVAESERKRKLRAGEAGIGAYLTMRKPPISYTQGVQWLRDGGGLIDGLRRYRQDRATHPDRLAFYDRNGHFRSASALLGLASTQAFAERTRQVDPAALFTGRDLWGRIDISITRLICETYLLCNGITQGDRLSMATSVEGRLPLVDYRLIETVIGLRKAQPDHRLPPKAWLIGAVRDLVPPFVFERRKRGFTPPWKDWAFALAAAYGQDLVDGLLVGRGVLRRDAAAEMSRCVSSIGTPLPLAMESLVLEQWCRGMAAAADRQPVRRVEQVAT